MRSRTWIPPLLAVLFIVSARFAEGYVQFAQVLAPKEETQRGRSKYGFVATLKAAYGRPSLNYWSRIGRTGEDHNCILPKCTRMGEVLDIYSANVTRYDRDSLKDMATKKSRAVEISHNPSGGILLQETNSDRWFIMYTFETPNPGVLYRVRVRLENDTDLASRLTIPVNFGRFGGLWKPRASSLTPDSVMIGTEGVPPDGRIFSSVSCLADPKEFECLSNFDSDMYFDILDFMRYFIRTPEDLRKTGKLDDKPENGIPGFKVYRYGFPYTVSLKSLDDDRVVDEVDKLYAVGRTGAQGVAVMQNGVTMYLSGGTGGLFKYEDSGDGTFTSGVLYAAKFTIKTRISEISVGDEFKIEWIKLAETDIEDVRREVTGDPSIEPLNFEDIFDYDEPRGSGCGPGQEFIEYDEYLECLKVKDETKAAIFEPARLALLKGATIGVFRFSEIATRLNSNKIYIGAMRIVSGILSVGSGKDTTLVDGNTCGCVFEIDTDENTGNAFSMRAIMCGIPTPDDLSNKCSTERVANPRTLTYANNFENLLIGEDSTFHENNYMWGYDPATGYPQRIFTAPLKGSVTSVNWFQDVVGGNNYIGITIAHPFDTRGWLSYLGSFDLTGGQKLTFSSVGVPYAVGPKGLPSVFRVVTTGVAEKIPGFTELIHSGKNYKQAGSKKGTVKIGLVVDENFKPVSSYEEGPGDPKVIDVSETHHSFGFSSLIDMCGTVYSVVSTNSIPAVTYVFSYVKEKKKKGQSPKLQVADVDYVDWSKSGGLWPSGSGHVSPWNTHIAGEAFEPDAMDFLGYPCLTGFSGCFKSRAEDSFTKSIQFVRYFGTYFDDFKNKFDKLGKIFNPYKYGYVYEVKISKNGCTSPTKYMTLGRFSHGDMQIMPDGKTVYMTDWTQGREVGGGLFKFIADKRHDLSAGTLYAAAFQPRRGTLKSFDIKWIRLGSANNGDLVKMSDKIKFADIFESIPGTKACRLQIINVKSRVECLDVKPGMETYAAFFETRRYAALRKASIELANVKGIAYDPTTSNLFVTINRVTARDKIMLQDDIEGSTNTIKVPLSPCGCVYKMAVNAEDYDTKEFKEYYCGSDDQGTVGENRCDVEQMANPKDLTSIPGHRQIIIAEDSCRLDTSPMDCGHVNNALWVVDPTQRSEKTRIMTGPPRSAITSTVWYPSVGDAAYISVVANELYLDGFNQVVRHEDDEEEPAAIFGVIGPFVLPEADARRSTVKSSQSICYDRNLESTFTCPAGVKAS